MNNVVWYRNRTPLIGQGFLSDGSSRVQLISFNEKEWKLQKVLVHSQEVRCTGHDVATGFIFRGSSTSDQWRELDYVIHLDTFIQV